MGSRDKWVLFPFFSIFLSCGGRIPHRNPAKVKLSLGHWLFVSQSGSFLVASLAHVHVHECGLVNLGDGGDHTGVEDAGVDPDIDRVIGQALKDVLEESRENLHVSLTEIHRQSGPVEHVVLGLVRAGDLHGTVVPEDLEDDGGLVSNRVTHLDLQSRGAFVALGKTLLNNAPNLVDSRNGLL